VLTVSLFCLGMLWALWKTRHALVFEDKIVPSPEAVLYKLVMMVESWARCLERRIMPGWRDWQAPKFYPRVGFVEWVGRCRSFCAE